ncbi:aminotransferase family protein-like protein [Xylogone sp. PMI_703]|nr:aminotransferase family protein-like protein [Xylogone sp. PMI_703]
MSTLPNIKSLQIDSNDEVAYERTPFGKEMRKHFLFDPKWKNINHGSFGTFPRAIKEKRLQYLDECESKPDKFIRYTYPELLDQNREAVAKLLNVPTSAIVFVPNATTAVNTVLRNLVWSLAGTDEILYFDTIYGACGKTINYICETHRGLVSPREIHLTYPIENSEIESLFRAAIKASKQAGKTPRVAVFDLVSSLPGVRFPFEALTKICRDEGVLSLIDGAHGIGHLPLDLSVLQPDFLTSNCHKWLFLPRGCALLYVPEHHQHLMRSTLPTSHGFVPLPDPDSTKAARVSPLPPSKKSDFVNAFEFVGSIDNTNYITAIEAIRWREEVCGGEKAIYDYCINLAREGAKAVVEILGTEVLDDSKHAMTECCLFNVRLPVNPVTIAEEDRNTVTQWIAETAVSEYDTFMAIYFYQGAWWARLSSQVYLDLDDFKWAGKTLKALSERVGRGEAFQKAKL